MLCPTSQTGTLRLGEVKLWLQWQSYHLAVFTVLTACAVVRAVAVLGKSLGKWGPGVARAARSSAETLSLLVSAHGREHSGGETWLRAGIIRGRVSLVGQV